MIFLRGPNREGGMLIAFFYVTARPFASRVQSSSPGNVLPLLPTRCRDDLANLLLFRLPSTTAYTRRPAWHFLAAVPELSLAFLISQRRSRIHHRLQD